MPLDVNHLEILAQVKADRRLAASFRNAGVEITWNDVWPWLVLAATAAAVYAAYRVHRRRSDMSERSNDPWKLFRELCGVHQLDHASRSLVKKLSLACRFEQPALVFLVPEAFGGDRTPDAMQSSIAALLELRSRLFSADVERRPQASATSVQA